MSGGGAFFSSAPLATNSLSALPARRHCRYVQHAIDVGSEPAVPVALALHKLYEAPLLKEV